VVHSGKRFHKARHGNGFRPHNAPGTVRPFAVRLMRILQINKFFWLRGGAERYMFDLGALLESNGHEVIHFAMADERNRPSPQSGYFVSPLDYGGMSPLRAAGRAGRILGGTVYSFEARRKLRALLNDLKPDLAHLHLIDHHLSPSILHALRDAGVPAVQSIHDYKLVCPNYQLYVPQRNELCERCLPGKFYHCVGQRCMKESLGASALVTGAMYFHKAIRIYENHVSAFLCSTEFLRAKLAKGGAPETSLRHVPLFIDLDRFARCASAEDYFVYAGRLVPEKGLRTLLTAMRELPDTRLILVGDGPARDELEALVRAWDLSNVQFSGFVDGDAYVDLLARARALVLPSELYETCGLVIWEANALGRPAIGSRIGGIPESIVDTQTGLLVEPGNAIDLAEKMRTLADAPDRADEMGARARDRVREVCAGQYDRILSVYEDVLSGARS